MKNAQVMIQALNKLSFLHRQKNDSGSKSQKKNSNFNGYHSITLLYIRIFVPKMLTLLMVLARK